MLRIVLSIGIVLLVLVTGSRMMTSRLDPQAFDAQGPSAASQALSGAAPQQVAEQVRMGLSMAASAAAARASEAQP